ncbi:unnamed protein product [Somion occarium]|uniref:Uncharacterized protein n=1 Tax=Somion occarium TaxID=3059160 RepID=A0ABP1DRE9_9APHY
MAVRKARTRFPDISILLVDGEKQDDLPLVNEGIEVLDIIIGVIIEIKNYISRRLDPNDASFNIEIGAKLMRAQRDLLRQAAYLFINYPQQQDVMAIAATGPYWTYAILERVHVNHLMNVLRKEDKDYNLNFKVGDRKPEWKKHFILGVSGSNRMLHRIHRLLKEKAEVGAKRLTGVDILPPGRG